MSLDVTDKSDKPFQVNISADVERVVTNDGSGRRFAVALKMFKDIVMKLSATKF